MAKYVEVRPREVLTFGSAIEFLIQENSEDYLDLLNTFLLLTTKVTMPNGDSIPLEAGVAPVNYYLNRLITQVDVSLKDILITQMCVEFIWKLC